MMKSIPQDRKVRLKAATICTAEEVAETVCWLATDAPACINGDVIDMNMAPIIAKPSVPASKRQRREDEEHFRR